MPAAPTTNFETTRLDITVLRGAGTWLHARSVELLPETLAVVASPSLIPLGEKLAPLDFCPGNQNEFADTAMNGRVFVGISASTRPLAR